MNLVEKGSPRCGVSAARRGRLVGRLNGWSIGLFVCLLVGWLVSWLVEWLVIAQESGLYSFKRMAYSHSGEWLISIQTNGL